MAITNRLQVALCTCAAVICLVLVLSSPSPVYGLSHKSEWTRPPHDLNVVCYVSTWANYRLPPAGFSIDNIDPSLCTHLLYAFVGLHNQSLSMISLDPWTDLDTDEGGRGGFRQMTGLRTQHPHLTVLLAVGGYDEGSVKFSTMASSIITRKRFIESALAFVQKYEFDGLDLDWEFPGERGGVPEDRENFVTLVTELRTEFDKFGLILTAAVHAGVDTMVTAYDFPALTEQLNLFNIMAYDYHGAWDNITGSNAPLYHQEDLWSVEDTLLYLKEVGVPLEKVMLGLAMYGHTFLLDDPTAEGSQELGAPCASDGFAGPYTTQNGFFGYYEVCLEIQDPKWKQYWDNNTGTPYIIAKEKVISYDDEMSLTLKVDYAVRFGVGGLMIWSIDTDDFQGHCSDEGNQYPLLKRINSAIVETLGSQTTTADPNVTTVETTTVEITTTTDPSTEWTRPPHDLNVVCYVSTWANYRVSPSNFMIESIDPRLCTHLIYAFAGLDNKTFTIISLDPWTDLDPDVGRGFYRQMTGLKKQHAHLKVLLGIGGYDEESAKYSELAGSTIRRTVFVNSAVEFVLEYEFDGLDLDWEYPGERGGVPEDKENFVILVKELRTEFDKHGLLLTAAFHAAPDTMATAYDLPALGEHLDLMNIMAYDFHGSFDNVTGANSPLYSQPDNYSVTDSLLYLRDAGAPLHKVMLGLPVYAHTFLLDDPNAEGSQEFGAPCDNTGFPGNYTNSSGFMGYHEVCLERQNSKWKQYWDDDTGTPYLIFEEKVISYDDELSITLKVDYAVRFGIGGLMAWSIDTDDFQGHCGGNKFPILKRISLAVVDTLNCMDNETTTIDPELTTITSTSTPVETSTMVTTSTGRPAPSEPPHNHKVICYVKTWANYRVVPSDYFIEDIDPTLCTHLMYAFAGLDNNTYEIISLDPWTDLDEDGGRGFFKQMTGLRADHAHLKVMLAIGGEGEGSPKYSQLAADPAKREKFVESVIRMLLKYEFNGLDLNWQFPGERGGVPEDRDNFVLLVKDLRDRFDRYGFILSAALHGGVDVMERAYDIPALGQYLHLMNIMAYDYHGSFENVTGANAPFYSQPDNYSVTDTLTYLKSAGAPLDKVMLGVPMYGQTYVMTDPEEDDAQQLGAPCDDTGFPGVYTRSDGFMGYHEVCMEAKDSYWKQHWDNSTGTPYMIYREKLAAFDDENSIAMKVDYGVKFGIGGFAAWSIDTDDFRGHCGHGRYPLLNKISSTIVKLLISTTSTRTSTTTKTTTSTATTTKSSTTSSQTQTTGSTTGTTTPPGGGATSAAGTSILYLLVVALISVLVL